MIEARPHPIVYRQRILDWRDRHSVAAMTSLNEAWRNLRPVVVNCVDRVGWIEALRSPNAFIRDQVDPEIAGHFAPIIANNVDLARTELKALFSKEWAVDTEIASTDDQEHHHDAALDVLKGVAPLAGGIAVGAALPSAAVLSGTALLGLVATSTVSMPVVFGGLALAGAGIATGAINTNGLREKAKKRMMARIDHHVARSLLDPKFDEKRPAVLARLLDSYKTTAAVALGED